MSFRDMAKSMLTVLTNTIGEDVTYTPSVGDAKTIKGIFNNQYIAVDPQSGLAVMTDQPNLGINLADLDADPANGDTVTIRSVSYKVREFQPDGEGGGFLLLSEA